MTLLKKLFRTKAFSVHTSKSQKELLELFLANKSAFEEWFAHHPSSKIRFRFYYPNAVDFYFSDFKMFTAYFKRGKQDEIELVELKISETNFDSIRCASWAPFEEVIFAFLTSLEETNKIALFEKRKSLYEYERLCSKKTAADEQQKDYLSPLSALLTR